MGEPNQLGRGEAKEETHPIVLHADPSSDIINQLQASESTLELAQIDIHLIRILTFLLNRLPRGLLHAHLNLLPQLDEAVNLLVVAFYEFGEEAETGWGVGGEGSEERGEEREEMLRVFVGRGGGEGSL